MWIQVRSMDGKSSHRVDDLSKLTKIEELRKLLVDKFNIPIKQQRLFYRGKQLEDGHTLFDYDVGLNDIVQILKRQIDVETPQNNTQASNIKEIKNKENEPSDETKSIPPESESVSQYFKVGDLVDGRDPTHGAWFEAKVVAIKAADKSDRQVLQLTKSSPQKDTKNIPLTKDEKDYESKDGLIYTVVFEDYEDSEGPIELDLQSLRPRAKSLIEFSNIKVGDRAMVNFNIEEPTERGFWYDGTVTDKKEIRSKQQLIMTMCVGPSQVELPGCKIIFLDEIFKIPENTPRIEGDNCEDIKRQKMPKCSHCKDNPDRKCKHCSCFECGGKNSPDKQIMCDECDKAFHIWCLDPPMEAIPEDDDWYCANCKIDDTEVVRAGEKLKASKKKSKMASANSSTSRDWGKGMACVGRTKVCTIVPSNHYGPIPGIEVGMMWKFRLQVSECGVHRPHVAGIHGRESDGAYSIVLSGGYEDDLDEGDQFYYTGSGGRDLSGNKRCAEQSCDQTLTRMNKALAANCNVMINKEGAEAADWKAGKPVRVVRNCKGRKHSNYSPEEGNRYDGIYKVVKYWPEAGKSGFLVWRYLLRRDDPAPAPWTKTGKKRIKELGLELQYPDGYLESLKEKESSPVLKKKSKNKRELSDDEEASPQKRKKANYKIPNEIFEKIKEDAGNQKLWEECLKFVRDGKQEFLKKVEETFQCICCQEIVYQPITTPCFHNICKVCLKRSFNAEVYTCPTCRQNIEKSIVTTENSILQKILLVLFPGYNAAR